VFGKGAPAFRLAIDAVNLPRVAQNGGETGEFLVPVCNGPVGAIQMAAAMVGDLVTFRAGLPNLVETGGNILAGRGVADIRPGTFAAGRPVGAARVGCKQIDTRQEVGELGVGLGCKPAAALPLLYRAGAIE